MSLQLGRTGLMFTTLTLILACSLATVVFGAVNLYVLTYLPLLFSVISYLVLYGNPLTAEVDFILAVWVVTGLAAYVLGRIFYFKIKKTTHISYSSSYIRVLSVITLGLTLVTLYLFFVNLGGVASFIGTAMELRISVATGTGLAPVDAGRPSIPHVLSIAFFLYLTALFGASIANPHAPKPFPLVIGTCFLIIISLLISLNDISRGRVVDAIVIIGLAVYLSMRRSPLRRRARFLILSTLSSVGLLVAVTMLQGKSAIWDGAFFGALGSLLRYAAVPVLYFSEYIVSTNSYGGSLTSLSGFMNPLEYLGIIPDSQRAIDRGTTTDGFTAILVYPMLKWFIADFGRSAAILISAVHMFVAGCIDENVRSKSRGTSFAPAYFLVSLSAVWSFMTYKPLSNFYVFALVLAIFGAILAPILAKVRKIV